MNTYNHTTKTFVINTVFQNTVFYSGTWPDMLDTHSPCVFWMDSPRSLKWQWLEGPVAFCHPWDCVCDSDSLRVSPSLWKWPAREDPWGGTPQTPELPCLQLSNGCE